MSWSEAKWVVDNIVQKIGRFPNNMSSFTARPLSASSIGLRFKEPMHSYSDGKIVCYVAGVMIRMSETGYPRSVAEGTLVVDNKDLGKYENKDYVVSNLKEDVTYYFTAFPYSSDGVYNQANNDANRSSCAPSAGEKVKITVAIDDPSDFDRVTVTCVDETNEGNTKNATITSTQKTASFTVPTGDTYHIEYGGIEKYTKPDDTEAKVSVAGVTTECEVSYEYANIYGVQQKVSQTSPLLTRTHKAVGMTATASVGTKAGRSDFDNVMPWKGIQRETLSTGDIMVKIPKFYYRRYTYSGKEDASYMYEISDKPAYMFKIHPAFNHAGVESEYIYVGAYATSNDKTSMSNRTPSVSQQRSVMRANACSKGSGWGLIDISTVSAIQALIMVEHASLNSQAVIGRGFSDGSGVHLTGGADSISGHTGRAAGTDGSTEIVWRGIEGFWGNCDEFVDGIIFWDGMYRVCNDPSKYNDTETLSGYTAFPYLLQTNWSGSYVTDVSGLNNDDNYAHLMLPTMAGGAGGSESTYYCDGASKVASGGCVIVRGGADGNGSKNGLFGIAICGASYTSSSCGSRLMWVPTV